jgi:hypothetical protein
MTNTFFSDNATLISPRTAKYVEAMIREDFNYNKWLKKAREEDAQAKQILTAFTCHDVIAAQVDNPINMSGNRDAGRSASLRLVPETLRTLIASRPHRQAKNQTPRARLRRWLEKVRDAWDDFQESRTRDAVYGYLESVFAIVMHYKVRRRTNRLLRHAFQFADLPFDKSADPFSAVIRCTCGDAADIKMISKWARALRFVARSKEPDSELRTFMKKAGGINACAERYAKLRRRGR